MGFWGLAPWKTQTLGGKDGELIVISQGEMESGRGGNP